VTSSCIKHDGCLLSHSCDMAVLQCIINSNPLSRGVDLTKGERKSVGDVPMMAELQVLRVQ
jgi:hypothetical protein